MIHYMTSVGIGQPWVGNELRIVQKAGVPFVLHAMRAPDEVHFSSDWASRINAQTRVLYPLPPIGFLVSLLAAPFLFRGRFFAALGNALFGKRESLRQRVAALWHFLVACHWARGMRHEPVSHIHSQWIHSNGTIAMCGAWLLGRSFSFTGHAADIFRNRVALEDKIRRADFIICISTFHRDYFKKLGARDEQLVIAYCGIDTTLFTPPAYEPRRDGPVHILSSGRLVEKKGFEYLIDACKALADRGLDLKCTIAGSGPLDQALRARIEAHGLTDRVTVTGEPINQEDIPAFMHSGDLYALPCVWASDDDVDGLPQMLMEAMACEVPAISTRLVGIPDLVIHEKTGLLVEPRTVDELADAIERLANDGELAKRLAAAGRDFVREKFDLDVSLNPLIQKYREKLAAAGAATPG